MRPLLTKRIESTRIFLLLAFASVVSLAAEKGLATGLAAQAEVTIRSDQLLSYVLSSMKPTLPAIPTQTINVGNLSLKDPYPVSIEGIQVAADVELSPQFGSTISVGGKLKNLRLYIQNIRMNTEIVKVIGSVEARIRLDVTCTGIQGAWSGWEIPFEMGIDVGLFAPNGVFAPSLSLRQIDVSVSQPTLPPLTMQCVGASGVEATIQQAAEAAFQQSGLASSFKPLIEQQIRGQADAILKSMGSDLLKGSVMGLKEYTLSQLGGKPLKALLLGLRPADASHATIYMGLTYNVEQNLAQNNLPTSFTLNERVGSPVYPDHPELRVPKGFIEALITEALSPGSWSKDLTTAQVPGFSDFMGWRIFQFFLWPDLLEFDSGTVFPIHISTYEKPVVELAGDRKFNVSLPIVAQMFRPTSGGPLPYMNFWMPIAGSVDLSGISPMTLTQFDLKYAFDADYVKATSPSTFFAKEMIGDRIRDALAGGSFFSPTEFLGSSGLIDSAWTFEADRQAIFMPLSLDSIFAPGPK